MVALLAGAAAAVMFAASTLASARASRLIGAWLTVGWVMAVGLPVAAVAVVVGGGAFEPSLLPLLAISGIGNVIGLGLEYAAIRRGRVGIVAPIVSTEGVIAAVLGVVLGSPASLALLAALGLIAAGGAVTVAAARPTTSAADAPPVRFEGDAVALSVLAALAFGLSLYSTGRLGETLPPSWAALAPRVVGVAFVTLPLAGTARLRWPGNAVPAILVAGVAEVLGFACIAIGSRADLPTTAIMASQFASLAVLGAMVTFRERPSRLQWLGIVAIAVGVGLAASQVR